MANEDRYSDDRDRYRRGDEGRMSEDRDRFGRGGERDHQGGWGGESQRRLSEPPGRQHGRDERDIYGLDQARGERAGMWGRSDEAHSFERDAARRYSREDYGSSGYGGGHGREQRDAYGPAQGFGEVNRERYQNRDFGSRGNFGSRSDLGGRSDFGSRSDLGGRGDFGGREDYRSRDDFRGQGGYGDRSYGGQAGRGYGGSYGLNRPEPVRSDTGRFEHGWRDERNERGLWDRASDEVASWFGDREAADRREQDYRGRGPKGYRRSDDRIREDVNDRLSDDPYLDASEVDVAVNGGEVTLSGTVDSRHARRRAEDIAESVSGVSHVQNNLRQRSAAGSTFASAHTSGGSHAGGSHATGGTMSAGTSSGLTGGHVTSGSGGAASGGALGSGAGATGTSPLASPSGQSATSQSATGQPSTNAGNQHRTGSNV